MSAAATEPQRASVPSAELGPGQMMRLRVGELPVLLVRTATGELRAYRDRCLHQGAPLSRGRLLSGTAGERGGEYRRLEDQSVIKCPWHGYEYDAASGCALFDSRRRLRPVAVAESGGEIVVRTSAG